MSDNNTNGDVCNFWFECSPDAFSHEWALPQLPRPIKVVPRMFEHRNLCLSLADLKVKRGRHSNMQTSPEEAEQAYCPEQLEFDMVVTPVFELITIRVCWICQTRFISTPH